MRTATYVSRQASHHTDTHAYVVVPDRSVTASLVEIAPHVYRPPTSFDVRRPWAWIRAAQRARSQGAAGLLTLLEELRTAPQDFLVDLRSIRTDASRFGNIVSRSYWHRNGFAKVKLVEWDDFALRLHVWPEGKDRAGDMNPHGHRWDFASWLLTGEGMIERHYAESAADRDDVGLYVRCHYGRKNGVDYLKHHRVAYLRQVAEHERTGGVYTCRTDVIHTVDPIGLGFMATVVLQSRAIHKNTRVYLKPDSLDEQEVGQPIHADELHRLLDDLEIAMGAAPRH